MEVLKLRFASAARPDLTLGIGMHGIGRARTRGGLDVVADGQQAVVRFCVDRRGVWLSVSEGERGVHVNGREIRRLAMLRIGDAVYVDGIEMRLVGGHRPTVPADAPSGGPVAPDPRVVLRGIGGQHHGRSFTLEQPRTVGSAAEADIRIDEAAFAERHARLELGEGWVVLRDLGSAEGSQVNGETVRDAVLLPGDQVVFDSHHRFVVEGPGRPFAGQEPISDALPREAPPAPASSTAGARPTWRLPWLLLAALALAALLSLLLLYGRG